MPSLEIYKNAPLSAIVKQLEFCHFQCEGGPLENNVAFIELKHRAANPTTKLRIIKQEEKEICPLVELALDPADINKGRILVLRIKDDIDTKSLEEFRKVWDKALGEHPPTIFMSLQENESIEMYSFEIEKD